MVVVVGEGGGRLFLSPDKWVLRRVSVADKEGKKKSLEGRANWLCLTAELSPPGLVARAWWSALRGWALVYGPRKKGTIGSRDPVRASDSPHTGPRDSGTHHKMLRHVSNTCQLSPSGTWLLRMKVWGERGGTLNVRVNESWLRDDFEGQQRMIRPCLRSVPNCCERSWELQSWALRLVSQVGREVAPVSPSSSLCRTLQPLQSPYSF